MSNRFRIHLFLVALVGWANARAAVLNVPGQYAGIQQAINAAAPGDTVQVSAGTYPGNISLRAGVTLQGCGPAACILQGDGSSAVLTANQLATAATIDGFTIQGGAGFTVPWAENRIMGGAIFADGSLLNIGHNKIIGNHAQIGGGIAAMNSTLLIVGNTIQSNQATTANPAAFNMGGGIYLYDSTGEISGNQILGNLADSGTDDPSLVIDAGSLAPGGGIAVVFSKLVGKVSILGNTISNNTAAGSQHYGGGIYLYQPAQESGNQVYVLGNILSGNQALDGGGLASVHLSPLVVGNRFANNSGHWGGGLYGFAGGGIVAHNRFAGNDAVQLRDGALTGGGGLLCDADYVPLIAHNLFDGNTAVDYGGGVEVFDSGTQAVVWKNRLQGNSARFGGGLVASHAAPGVFNNWFSGNSAGTESGGGLFAENTSGIDLRNNLFEDNTADRFGGGAAMVNVTNAKVFNNTFNANQAGPAWWAGGLYANGGSLNFQNNIVSNNGKFGAGVDNGASMTRAYNDFYQNDNGDCFNCPPGQGELTSAPGFADTATYRLAPGSANVNAGNPAAAHNDRDGSRNDVGAYGGPGVGSLPYPGAVPTAESGFDFGALVLSLPQVDLGTTGGRLDAELQLLPCRTQPNALMFKLTSFHSVASQPASEGAFYWHPFLVTPSVEVLGNQFDAVFSLQSCGSDPAGLYLRLEAMSLSL